jgi:predicted RNA-binding protein YlqC (UPF0109 family)
MSDDPGTAIDAGVPGAGSPEAGAPEPGNALDVEGAVDDMAGNRVTGGTARAVLSYIVGSIVEDPEAAGIEAVESGEKVRLEVHAAPGDMGRLIGRRGRVAQAIRTVVRVAGSRDGVQTEVDFVD